jgi:hypothetical protein
MVPEADVEQTEDGLVPSGEGWYVLNARDARWRHADGRGAIAELEGEQEFPQVGVNVFVLGAGEPMSMYHWEADQEESEAYGPVPKREPSPYREGWLPA